MSHTNFFTRSLLLRRVLQFILRCVLPLRFLKFIINRFATLFPFLIRVSQLRWQQVFGTGSALLAAFLALAGAAWSLDLPEVLCFNLFCAIYLLFIYLSIYIEIRWGVYERTKELIKNTWLFRKMKNAFTLVFFLQDFFLISSFGIFVFCYQLMFPEIEKGNLVNPLQVIAQLSCFLLNFQYPLKPVRVRHLLLLCFFLSILSSLHLQGIDWQILSLVLFFFLILINFFPYAHLIIFCGYFLDQGLAKWGFFLSFQQVCYYALSFFLEKEQSSSIRNKRCLSWILLLIIQFIYGFFYYEDFYLMDPLKLAALLSGACIIFISLSRRTKWAFQNALLFYFLISLFIGIQSAPSDKTTILGIPDGLFIFVFMHFWVFLGLFFFKDSLPRRMQPFLPLFFGGLFFFLGNFPELAWLFQWIKGMDLLLLILGAFHFVEGEKSYQRRMTTIPFRKNSRRRDRFFIPPPRLPLRVVSTSRVSASQKERRRRPGNSCLLKATNRSEPP